MHEDSQNGEHNVSEFIAMNNLQYQGDGSNHKRHMTQQIPPLAIDKGPKSSIEMMRGIEGDDDVLRQSL